MLWRRPSRAGGDWFEDRDMNHRDDRPAAVPRTAWLRELPLNVFLCLDLLDVTLSSPQDEKCDEQMKKT
jgi:hypothetical protein